MTDYLRVRLAEVGNVTVVTLADRTLVDGERIEILGRELLDLVDRDHRTRLIVDFRDVEFLSSAMLNKLLMLDKRVKEAGGVLKICGLSPDIAYIFELTSLNALFDIRRSADDALTAF